MITSLNLEHGQTHQDLHPHRRRRYDRSQRFFSRSQNRPTHRGVGLLSQIQNELFDLGADLSNPLNEHYEYEPLRVDATWIDALEEAIDYYNSKLEKLDSFIIPGGSGVAAGLHLARTVVRRAERATWHAIEEHGTEPAKKGHKDGGVSILAVKYLNRLSDLLFVLARYANINHGGDVKWVPAANRREAPAKRRPEQD